MKKLGIFTLIGLSVFLAGCTIPGVPDPQQVADQTRMLTEMQQQMASLLSGMTALQQQNDQMSGVLLNLESYIESQKKAIETVDADTHGAASLSDPMLFGGSGSSENTSLGIDFGHVDMSGEIASGYIDTGAMLGTGSAENISSDNNKDLLLEGLKKVASKKSGSGENSTGTKDNPLLEK